MANSDSKNATGVVLVTGKRRRHLEMKRARHVIALMLTLDSGVGCSVGGMGWGFCKHFRRKGYRVFATSRRAKTMEGLTELGCEVSFSKSA